MVGFGVSVATTTGSSKWVQDRKAQAGLGQRSEAIALGTKASRGIVILGAQVGSH